MSRGRFVADGRSGSDAAHLLAAFGRALDDQPRALTRRFGVVNLYWIAVEELGPARGPRALDALVAGGFLRRGPHDPDIGRITPAGQRLLQETLAAAA